MKNVLIILAAIIMMASPIADANATPARQEPATLKQQMELIHNHFGVNFVYDSAIDLDIPYTGKALNLKSSQKDEEALAKALETIFKGTEIEYEIMKKYIVLTKAGQKKKPRDYTIFIEEQKDTLTESYITVHIDRQRNTTQTGLHTIDFRRFGKGFAALSSPDVIKEIQILPGVSGGTELLSGLYVHGGDGSDNLFLLDGVPLYQVTHMAGLISSFNTEMINNLDFYKSGFPSRFGGKLSSVSDITTRQGDMNSYHGSFNIGLLNGGIQFEGPIVPGKTSFNVGLRRSWFDVFTIPAMAIYNSTRPYGEKARLRYAMTDFNASLTHIIKQDSRLAFNIYTGSDVIRYGNEALAVNYWEGTRVTGKNGHDMNIRWGNILASLNWKKRFSDDLHLNTNVYYTRVNTDVRMSEDRWELQEYEAITTEHQVSERNRSRLHDIAAKADIDWIPSEYHHLRAGASFVYHMFRPYKDVSVVSTRRRVDAEESYYNTTYVQERDSVKTPFDSPELSVYAEDEIAFTGWLKANLGARYTMFGTETGLRHSVEPRAAVRFQLGPKTSLKMSYTEMSQFIHNLQANYIDIPMSIWVPSTDRIAPMRSRQIAGGIYTELPHNIRLNVEGYWKTMENLHEYCGINAIYPEMGAWVEELLSGRGRAYGAEMELGWSSRNTDISVYYTLSWTERFFDQIWHDWYPARNDNRNKLTVNATHRFNGKFDMYMQWNYHTGDRTTIPTQIIDGILYYSNPYNHKLPDYHRLDIGFNFRKTTRRGNESIWNLSIYNAYCRMNPLFAMVSTTMIEGKVEDYKFVTLGVLPIIPTFSYTLKF